MPLCRAGRALWLFPALRWHHHRSGDQGKPDRCPGDGPSEQALRGAADPQPGLGHRRAAIGHESLHGPTDLLLLRRGHGHFPRR
ncbi:hypothetical protein G6F31_021119 [Rhizopus arrhizus]|nr:hypothetical protein G6F31_021119 [Rhizopus arrhizus]